MSEDIKKKDINLDFLDMDWKEYDFILSESGLSKTQLGKNACKIIGRTKPYVPSAICHWYYQNKMTGKQIFLLQQSLPDGYFETYRQKYVEHKRKQEEIALQKRIQREKAEEERLRERLAKKEARLLKKLQREKG